MGIGTRERLEADVVMLAETIGERHLGRADRLARAADWLKESLAVIGYEPSIQSFQVDGDKVRNVEVVHPGRDPNLGALVVGAHYDTVPTSPGADDNASGVAALLEIARSLKELEFERTVRLVFFVNEEWPHFQTETMGSLVYAKACRERNENLAGMIALESLAYYSNEPGSQTYPSPELSTLFPETGNFLALVGNEASAPFLEQFRESFPKDCPVPIHAIALPEASRAVGWSDHWSFWQAGYPAVMVTDTVPFRNPHYHEPSDTASTLCFGEFAAVTWGLIRAIRKLSGLGPR